MKFNVNKIPKISTGEPSTLKTYRTIAMIMSGSENSTAVKFIDSKIKEQGENAIVIADERQMIYLIGQMVLKDVENDK